MTVCARTPELLATRSSVTVQFAHAAVARAYLARKWKHYTFAIRFAPRAPVGRKISPSRLTRSPPQALPGMSEGWQDAGQVRAFSSLCTRGLTDRGLLQMEWGA